VLPTPPEDVVDTLRKVAGMDKLKTAVVPNGFRFAEPPSSYFRKDINEHIRGVQQRYNRQVWLDPIVYVEYEGTTAIVAQFGEFPVERKIIEQVCRNPDYLF
jgi:hypothetical protein